MGNIPTLYIIPLALIALAVILYCAFSRKSSPAVRRLAIIALIMAVLATMVCGYFIVTASSAEEGAGAGISIEQPAAGPAKVNWQDLLIFVVFLLLLLVSLIVLARRSKRPKPRKEEPQGPLDL
jgi:ABC-type Fe3+-siderophore transport system permease subunit